MLTPHSHDTTNKRHLPNWPFFVGVKFVDLFLSLSFVFSRRLGKQHENHWATGVPLGGGACCCLVVDEERSIPMEYAEDASVLLAVYSSKAIVFVGLLIFMVVDAHAVSRHRNNRKEQRWLCSNPTIRRVTVNLLFSFWEEEIHLCRAQLRQRRVYATINPYLTQATKISYATKVNFARAVGQRARV